MNEPTAAIPTSAFDWSIRRVQALAQAHGNAFYVVDLKRFESNVVRLVNAFRNYYPNVCLAYSYKTNYVPSVCLKADQMGAFAEVVSPFEYNLEIRLGIVALALPMQRLLKENVKTQEAPYYRDLSQLEIVLRR